MSAHAPNLFELQHEFGRDLLRHDGGAAPACIRADGLDSHARLAIYRNTATSTLVMALRLSYPAIQSLVGSEFFEGMCRLFIEQTLPHSAWLDAYGSTFPDFLANLPEAAALAYLPDTARLEWAVNAVLHAPDAQPLDLARLAHIGAGDLYFAPHPAIRLLQFDFPVDAIWHAVLMQDDHAMAEVDLTDGPVWLCIRRAGSGIEIDRFNEQQWHFSTALIAGQALHVALSAAPQPDAQTWLATLLANGCFAAVSHAEQQPAEPIQEQHP